MLEKLNAINSHAHVNTFHPNSLSWPEQVTQDEQDYLSRFCFGVTGEHDKAIAYIAKELAQLAEIEKHVTAVLTIALSELQGFVHPLNQDYVLHNALSCFGAEELNHANTFFRYVRHLTNIDFRLAQNLFEERVAVYQQPDSPFVKLVAMHASAYVGESVITAFEYRARDMDPDESHFFTEVLIRHALDEHRHVEFDHFVFDEILPTLSDAEKARAREMAMETERLNGLLAGAFEQYAINTLGTDYRIGNNAWDVQMKLTARFRDIVFSGSDIGKVDNALTDEDRALLTSFSGIPTVHAQYLEQASA
ncbi:MAG TPA: hypothetical protein DEA26_01715 [Oceanospirillales bacterium]|nr:hypothetical protein [Oceanospirillaceae bacterium]HBS41367.1 hypothetical protein [Oceanospirillales bacterium]|tara:strand:- start:111 stop:1031 length:921 start_codon:yes stop_codon:yes gene_type:complete